MQASKFVMSFFVLSVAFLTGCEDRVGLAEQKMQEIRQQTARPVTPPPVPQMVEEFTYSAQKMRSPFMPPSLMIQANQVAQIQGVQPDVTRLKEPLEAFELSELIYKGTVVSTSGELYGLIQRPDGSVASVKTGNYMGKHHGRIVEITPSQINLIEIVPDSRVGYVEKPNSIVSPAG